MSRKIYNKLIRDKIPLLIKKNGALPKVLKLDDFRYRKALKKKLIEEAKETKTGWF